MAKQQATDGTPAAQVVMVPVLEVKRNPRNYRGHPREQVAQIEYSLRDFGQYKPLILSRDGFLLAGHGVLEGAIAEGREQVACVYMPFAADDPKADKLLVADNELSRMAEDDTTALAALLADVQRTEGLQGTGYDDAGLEKIIGALAAEEFAESLGGYGLEPDKLPNTGFHFSLDGEEAAHCNAAITKALAELGPEVDGMLPVDAKSKAFLLICEAYL